MRIRKTGRASSTSLSWLSKCMLLTGALSSNVARADPIDRCLAAHAQSQRLRQDGKLRASREQLLLCAREPCPSVVRAECGQWLTEVDASIPSVVISARAGTVDLTAVRIVVDGEPMLERLDGRELALDPGPHTLRVEGVGLEPTEQKVLLREHEKARPIIFVMARPAAPPSSAPERQEALMPSRAEAAPRPVPATVYVAGGLALIALGSFAYFGLSGRSEYFDLKNRCGPTCASADAAPMRTKLLLADVSLGVSVVALGAAAYFFFTRPAVEPARVDVDLRVVRGGATASAGWSF